MVKVVRTIFIILGCIAPIAIGALHSITHFTQLTSIEINQFLQKEFIILGTSQPLWNTWGTVSFMMGTAMMVIGLLNMTILKKTLKTEPPPKSAFVALLIFQLCVLYVGYEFNQNFQFYGGLIGSILCCICIVFLILRKPKLVNKN